MASSRDKTISSGFNELGFFYLVQNKRHVRESPCSALTNVKFSISRMRFSLVLSLVVTITETVFLTLKSTFKKDAHGSQKLI